MKDNNEINKETQDVSNFSNNTDYTGSDISETKLSEKLHGNDEGSIGTSGETQYVSNFSNNTGSIKLTPPEMFEGGSGFNAKQSQDINIANKVIISDFLALNPNEKELLAECAQDGEEASLI
jgi:hypothetical protein